VRNGCYQCHVTCLHLWRHKMGQPICFITIFHCSLWPNFYYHCVMHMVGQLGVNFTYLIFPLLGSLLPFVQVMPKIVYSRDPRNRVCRHPVGIPCWRCLTAQPVVAPWEFRAGAAQHVAHTSIACDIVSHLGLADPKQLKSYFLLFPSTHC